MSTAEAHKKKQEKKRKERTRGNDLQYKKQSSVMLMLLNQQTGHQSQASRGTTSIETTTSIIETDARIEIAKPYATLQHTTT
jgi:hypothetical protein